MEMEIYQQIKAGNKEVIKNVYKENAKDVYNFAKSITGDHESALEATKKAFVTLFTQIRNDEYPINIRLGAMKIAYDEACSMTMASKSEAESPYNPEYVNKLSFEETASEETEAAPAGQEAASFGAAAAGAAFSFNNAAQYDASSVSYTEQPVMFDAYGQPVPVMNDPYGQQAGYPMNYDAPGYMTQDLNGNVFYNTPQNQPFNQAQGAFNPYNNNQMYAQAPAAFGNLPDGNSGTVNPAVNNMFYNNGANVYAQPGQPVNFGAQGVMYNNAGQPVQPMNYGAQPMMYNNAGQPVQPMNYGARPMMYNNAGQPMQPMNYGAQPMMYNNAGQPVQPADFGAQGMSNAAMAAAAASAMSIDEDNSEVQTDSDESIPESVGSMFYTDEPEADNLTSENSDPAPEVSSEKPSEDNTSSIIAAGIAAAAAASAAASAKSSDDNNKVSAEDIAEEDDSYVPVGSFPCANTEKENNSSETDETFIPESAADEITCSAEEISELKEASEAEVSEVSEEPAGDVSAAASTAAAAAFLFAGAESAGSDESKPEECIDNASDKSQTDDNNGNIEDDISYLDIETGNNTEESESAETKESEAEAESDEEKTETSEVSDANEVSETDSTEDAVEPVVRKRSKGAFVACLVIVIILVLLLIWFLCGLLINLGVIPQYFDLGYTWFNQNIYPLF